MSATILHIGTTPRSIIESVLDRIDEIQNVVVSVEFKDQTNEVVFNDIQNGYEVIGRLVAMIEHVRAKQTEGGLDKG